MKSILNVQRGKARKTESGGRFIVIGEIELTDKNPMELKSTLQTKNTQLSKLIQNYEYYLGKSGEFASPNY